MQTAKKPENIIYCTYENAKLLHIVIAVTSGSPNKADTKSDATLTITDNKFKEGENSLTHGAGANSFAYVVLKTTKGVFDPTSETLTSNIIESSTNPAAKITMEESSSDPHDAIVKFESLKTKAPGTVYILNGKDTTAGTAAQIAAKDQSKALGFAEVEGGTLSVTVEDVFDGISTTAKENKFLAVFVPDDTELWSTIAGGASTSTIAVHVEFTLAAKETTYKIDGSTDEVTSGAASLTEANPIVTGVYLAAYDQFGTEMDYGTTVTGANLTDASATISPTTSAKLDVAASTNNAQTVGKKVGAMTFTVADTNTTPVTTVNKVKVFTIKLDKTGQTLTFKSTSNDGVAFASSTWKVMIS